ncbi:hypothetical protein PHYSODRAFT_506166 [Phytophthora sojae]|uniref:GIY-YIG domain-containing protein n=1 Tax=Phytophthora sojae (strain P6497) TaxID=1094619 RepID=G4ZNR2_PHYSP|nr:hypothetical protein PHYSODRAFT_506166 [Phytophthora sojae]EGZ15085.1 hypothetical protein PHYSODRAFT_506166 [Phytophthora sojae]|eukprot:XP_009528834.1 hypothetical protein PHYSODRAFT_506166 [Phytophthora sojae]
MIGRIYKISNADDSIVYIGSTVKPLWQRFSEHKCKFRRWINGVDISKTAIYYHFREHGVENFTISLISEHEIPNRKSLLSFEQLAIDSTQGVINKQAALRTKEEIQDHSAERIDCGCRVSYRSSNRSQHCRSRKHQQFTQM